MARRFTSIYLACHMPVFLVLLFFAFIAIPTADDFDYARKAREFGPTGAVVYEYTNWAARYTQVFVTSVWHRTFAIDSFPYVLGLLPIMGLLFCGIWTLWGEFFQQTGRSLLRLAGSFVILTAILRGLPTLDESVYWNITAVTYVLPCAGLAFLLVALLRAGNSEKIWLWQIPLSIGVLVIGGLNEVFGIIDFFVIAGFIAARFLQGRKFFPYLLTLASSFIVMGIIGSCPGRHIRETYYPQCGDFLFSVLKGGNGAASYFLQMIVDPYVWGSLLLFLPILASQGEKIRSHARWRIAAAVYFAVYALILFTIFAVHYYGTGTYPVARLLTVWYIIFLCGLVPAACYLYPLLQTVSNWLEKGVCYLSRGYLAASTLLAALVIISFLLVNNPPKAVWDISSNLTVFREDYRRLKSEIARQTSSPNKAETLYLHKFRTDPLLLKTPTDVDFGIGGYYGFSKTVFLSEEEAIPETGQNAIPSAAQKE